MIVQSYGGEVNDPELKAYVEGIVSRLMAASFEPDMPIRTTVLDSPVVNAMALPGHVYVTRGLLALANSEAELAGVLGHEIGHIFERHTAERVSRGNLAQLGAVAAAVLTGSAEMAQMGAQAGQLYLLNFSRSQEYEADQVGVKLLSRAGYDPIAQAYFLNTLNRWTEIELQISGASRPPEFLATHPNTAERVRRAAQDAEVIDEKRPGSDDLRRDAYLRQIDGMLYGEDPRRQGFVDGNDFIHPDIGFAFSVPQGMQIRNSSQAVIAVSENAQMQFQGAQSQQGPAALIGQIGESLGVSLGQPRGITVNGKRGAYGAARANTQNGQVDVQAFAIQWNGPSHFVFLWVTPTNATSGLQRGIEQSVQSLRAIDGSRVRVPPTLNLDIATVQRGDTANGLANQTRFPNAKLERFVVMNGLRDGNDLQAGQRVKIVR